MKYNKSFWNIVGLLGAIALQGGVSRSANAQAYPPTPALVPDIQEVYSLPAFPSDYLIGAGDQIAVTVLGYEEYTGSYTVLPNGTINLPLIGEVVVGNQTAQALAQELAVRLNEYLVDPAVTVTPVALRPVVVTISGEVARPGPVQLRSTTSATITTSTNSTTENTVAQPPTVSSALLEAGGITSNADIQQVVIKRPIGNDEVAMTTVNLWEVLVSGEPLQDLILQDGDAVFVPELPENTDIDRRLLATSTLAPSTIAVQVVGEVNDPGQVQVPPDGTLSSALSIAGGPTEDAQMSQVALVRLNSQGAVEREIIDLRELSDEYQIQAGDIVYVPKEDLRETVDFADRILNPIGAIFDLLFGFGLFN